MSAKKENMIKKEEMEDIKNILDQGNLKYFLLVLFVLMISVLAISLMERYSKMKTIVVFETNMGEFNIELYTDQAPITTKNFLSYVENGFYDGLIFHRVIPGFMIQGGGFTQDLERKETGQPIKNEADNGLKNEKYTVAMARTYEIDSATSQFFINTDDNTFLDHGARDFGYAVFGKVIEGMDVIDRIDQIPTHTVGSYDDVPLDAIVIKKAYVR